jgi:uncharacterized protein GlcG (DUF336 family)
MSPSHGWLPNLNLGQDTSAAWVGPVAGCHPGPAIRHAFPFFTKTTFSAHRGARRDTLFFATHARLLRIFPTRSMLHRIALRLLLLLQMHMHCHAALVAPRSNLLKLRGGKADDSRWLIPGKPTLTLEAADEMASAAIREATERGFNDVAVFVLDANGRTIVSKAMLNVPNLPVKLAHAKAMICVSTGSNSRAVRDKYVPDRTPQVAASETVANHPTPARSRSKTAHAAFTIFHCTDRSRVRVAHRAFAVAANVHRRRKRRAAARRGAWRCPGPRRLK